MYFVFLRHKRDVKGSSVLSELQTSALRWKYIVCTRFILSAETNLHTERIFGSQAATAVCPVREPSLLSTDHVEPVGEVPVLAGHLAGPVRVGLGGAQLHSYPGQFADLEVVAGLGGELEGSDELGAGGGPVLTQPDGGVDALTDGGQAGPGHHLEAPGRDQTGETALTHRLPGRPARGGGGRPLTRGPGHLLAPLTATVRLELVGGGRPTGELLANSLNTEGLLRL